MARHRHIRNSTAHMQRCNKACIGDSRKRYSEVSGIYRPIGLNVYNLHVELIAVEVLYIFTVVFGANTTHQPPSVMYICLYLTIMVPLLPHLHLVCFHIRPNFPCGVHGPFPTECDEENQCPEDSVCCRGTCTKQDTLCGKESPRLSVVTVFNCNGNDYHAELSTIIVNCKHLHH